MHVEVNAMSNLAKPYSLFISSGDDKSLVDLRNVCVQIAWDAGHSPKAAIITRLALVHGYPLLCTNHS